MSIVTRACFAFDDPEKTNIIQKGGMTRYAIYNYKSHVAAVDSLKKDIEKFLLNEISTTEINGSKVRFYNMDILSNFGLHGVIVIFNGKGGLRRNMFLNKITIHVFPHNGMVAADYKVVVKTDPEFTTSVASKITESLVAFLNE